MKSMFSTLILVLTVMFGMMSTVQATPPDFPLREIIENCDTIMKQVQSHQVLQNYFTGCKITSDSCAEFSLDSTLCVFLTIEIPRERFSTNLCYQCILAVDFHYGTQEFGRWTSMILSGFDTTLIYIDNHPAIKIFTQVAKINKVKFNAGGNVFEIKMSTAIGDTLEFLTAWPRLKDKDFETVKNLILHNED